jgi:hypothetical protein
MCTDAVILVNNMILHYVFHTRHVGKETKNAVSNAMCLEMTKVVH